MQTLELIEKVKQNDVEAFEELYNQFYPMGFSLALQFVKSEENAMDIMQDAFITLYSKIGALQEPEKFKSWYMQIVANKCRDFIKKKNPLSFTEANAYDEDGNFQFDIEDDDRDFQPEESVDYSETVHIVDEMLDNLPEDQKMCLLLYYANDMKISEIAESLGVSEATVKSRLKYGKEKLRIQVEEYEKKNGTKLYGVGAFGLLPFIKWMLSSTQKAAPSSSGIFEICFKKAAQTSGDFALKNVIGEGLNMSKETFEGSKIANIGNVAKQTAKKAANWFISLPTMQKVISGVVAVVILTLSVIGIGNTANTNTTNNVNSGYGDASFDNNEYTEPTEKFSFAKYIKFDWITLKDGNGSFNLVVDSETLKNVIPQSKIKEYIRGVFAEADDTILEQYTSIDKLFKFTPSKSTGLSNGDKIIVYVEIADALKAKGETVESIGKFFNVSFSTELYSEALSNLSQYEEINLYMIIKDYIRYEGGSGNGRIYFEFPKNHSYHVGNGIYVRCVNDSYDPIQFVVDNELIGDLYISISEQGNLSNGDSFTIGFGPYGWEWKINEKLKKKGYIVINQDYTHTATGFDEAN